MSDYEAARTQRDALHDTARRTPTEKSLKYDAAIRLWLASAAGTKPEAEEDVAKQRSDNGKDDV